MVRTKADSSSVKAAGAKAPRKALATPTPSSSSDSSTAKSSYGGGNSYHPRETPGWQKPITSFFAAPPTSSISSSKSGKCEEQSDMSAQGTSH